MTSYPGTIMTSYLGIMTITWDAIMTPRHYDISWDAIMTEYPGTPL